MPRPVNPRLFSCKHPSGPQTLFLIPLPVDPASLSCKCLLTHKPYFSYHFFERMPCPVNPRSFSCKCPLTHKPYFSYHVPLTHVHSHASVLRPTNLIFHTIFSSACHVPSTHVHSHASVLRAHKPYFSYHVPSTQLHSHASTLWPTNLIFHTNFSSTCHVPSTQVHSHTSVH